MYTWRVTKGNLENSQMLNIKVRTTLSVLTIANLTFGSTSGIIDLELASAPLELFT